MNHMDSAPIDRVIEVFGLSLSKPDKQAWHRARYEGSDVSYSWVLLDQEDNSVSDYVHWPQGWREVVVQDA